MNYEKIERWVSMNEIADYLGVTRDTVLAWTEKRGNARGQNRTDLEV